MTFKPFGKKYDFAKSALIRDFPDYFRDPIENWLWKLLNNANVVDTSDYYLSNGRRFVKSQFINYLQIDFREEFPQYWADFFNFIYSDTERLCNFLAYCLQKYADQDNAINFEYILQQGGSGYSVLKTDEDASEYTEGVYDLVDRVPPVVIKQSHEAISQNDMLMEAWLNCYSQKPDYDKVVVVCQNFLEFFLRDVYEPGNSKPQLGKLIGNLRASSNKLQFKGDSVIVNKTDLLNLIDKVAQFRGMHTAGSGKEPTKNDSEYILHTTIYIWNLHQK
jgi:hypothetical protein